MLDQDKVIEALVRRHRELESAVAELRGEQADIKAQLANIVEVGWKSQIDGVAASLREPNRKFDLFTAVSLLTPEQREASKVTSFDVKLVRAHLTDGQLEEAMIPQVDAVPVLKL